MDGRNLTDTECRLYGTKSCALLNMRSCEECPLKGRVADNQIVTDLKLFCDLQPEGSVAQLFESKTCTLCKTEPKGKRSCYAIFDMAHTEPKQLSKRRFFSRETTGFMVPLQFACCTACRRRLLLAAYLPLIVPILLTGITLPIVTIERTAEALRAVAGWFPLLIVAFAILGGYGLGRLLAYLYRKQCDAVTVTDLRTHPFVLSMQEKGWRPLFNDRQARVVFTKKRIKGGLGTAKSAVYAMADDGFDAEKSENSD